MLCFRVIFWGVVLIVVMIPFSFFVGIIGRLAGFRPGSQAGTVEKVFGWFGLVFLGGIMLGICLVAGLIDWGVSTALENNPHFMQNQTPQPKPIPAHWDEKKMQTIYLSDMQEFNTLVGWGNFGKKGKLGYQCAYGDNVQVDGKRWPNAISAVPQSFGFSRVSYRLDRNAKLFKTWAALSDTDAPFHRPESPATFRLFGDGVCLWASTPVRQNKQIEECRISVENVDTLELQVQCQGTNGNVRAVWLEPQILR